MPKPLMPSAKALLAEFLGTAFLLAAVVGSGIMGLRLADGNIAIALLANSIATGAALVILIQMFAQYSGAHFNPAVSIAFYLDGSLPVSWLFIYILVQVVGGCLGVILAHAMFDLLLLQVAQTVRTGAGQWIAECVAAFGLVLTILLTLRSRADFVPAAVGLYITAAYWFTSSTSFANPAVTIARAMTETFAGIRPSDVLAFIMAQVAGAVLAWWVAKFLQSKPEHT